MSFYVTQPIHSATKQISIDEILSGEITNLFPYTYRGKETATRTDFINYVPRKLEGTYAKNPFYAFCYKWESLINCEDLSIHYNEFRIPKAKGGFRVIDDPDPELRQAHKDLKELIESICLATYHTSAYAYVANRCPKDAVMKHKLNNSNWCLRTDFSNFFGSITHEFLCKMLLKQYPFALMTANGQEDFKKALKLCFLKDGLPQGTTISPMLTNLMMIPIDYTLCNELHSRNFVYTRYADDIQISAYSKFDKDEIVKYIDKTLMEFGAPFRIKPEKTKFSSVAGINYMLGLNLNKDHNITVGHARKKTFKAMVNNFMADTLNGVKWSVDNVNYMCGIYSYYRSIEPDYTDYMVRHLEEKYHMSFKEACKRILSGKE